MRITRIYADESGESRFADAEIQMDSAPLFPHLPPFRMCTFSGKGDIRLFSTPPELRMHDFHTAPTRQFAAALSGTVEYETSEGVVTSHVSQKGNSSSFLSRYLTIWWQPKSPSSHRLGQCITISYWTDPAALRGWMRNAAHIRAIRLGKR
jgi:hypothetical protein